MLLPDGKIYHKKDHTKYVYYAIDFPGDSTAPEEIASLLHIEHVGPIADLGYHLFRISKTIISEDKDLVSERFEQLKAEHHRLERREQLVVRSIISLEKQTPRRLYRKSVIPNYKPHGARGPAESRRAVIPERDFVARKLGIEDPGYLNQWHLHNYRRPGNDLNVTGVWLEGITGKGVTVGIIDDGKFCMMSNISRSGL